MTKIATVVTVGSKITHHWADGQTSSFDVAELPEEIRFQLMMLAAKSKSCDVYAEKGKYGVVEARARHLELIGAMKRGDWELRGNTSRGIWVEAIARATGSAIEAVAEMWAQADEKARKKAMAEPAVKLAKLEIEAERAKAAVAEAGTVTVSGLFGTPAEAPTDEKAE